MSFKNAGALWLKKKNGRKFFSGVFEPDGKDGKKFSIFVFRNEKKEGKQPDYRISMSVDGPSDADESEPF